MRNSTAPKFPKHVAQAIVDLVRKQVKSTLDDSKAIEGEESHEKDKTLGIFERSDLKLGKLLGSGGFSDVYEISEFVTTAKSQNNRKWTRQQSLAREVYQNNVVDRDGNSNYVVKHLKPKMMKNVKDFVLAATDLAVEARYLSSLKHDNILQIRGWAAEGIESYSNGEHDGYFLILDRLHDTLDKRLINWRTDNNDDLTTNFTRLSISSHGKMSNGLLSRIKVAHQIASALQYLHGKGIIFRDLKPNNIGFDEFGIVKLFDFGLARELPEECVDVNDVYCMSGWVGTLRYMAPEVALSKKYNQKVDTYSWAIILWYCLTLTKPYATMTRSIYLNNVCKQGERPAVENDWPESIHNLLRKSWAQDPCNRINMKGVCKFLEQIIETEMERGEEQISKPKTEARSFVFHPSLLYQQVPRLIRRTSITLVDCI